MDILSKKYFFFDLDDTLINTTEANELGLKKAYFKLSQSCKTDLSQILPFKTFKDHIREVYKRDGNTYYDYEAEVFEEFCDELLSRYDIKDTGTTLDSLSAKLFYYFRQTKNPALMAVDHAFDLLYYLRNKKHYSVFCITRGKCNYQHTKLLLTGLDDDVFDSLMVASTEGKSPRTKTERLSEEIKLKNIPLESAVIIGDNIKHDISAGHSVGIETIRILQGIHSDEESSNKKETPDMTFDSIKDLFKFFKDSDLAITKRL